MRPGCVKHGLRKISLSFQAGLMKDEGYLDNTRVGMGSIICEDGP